MTIKRIITGAAALTLLGCMNIGTVELPRVDQSMAFSTENIEKNAATLQMDFLLAALKDRWSGCGLRIPLRAESV